MGKYENKQKQTKKAINDAFMEIYANKLFQKITVNEICEKAKINRSTFYLHYDSIESMLREIEDTLLEQIYILSKPFEKYDFNNHENFQQFREVLIDILQFFLDNRPYTVVLLSNYASPYFSIKYKKIIRDSIERSLINNEGSFGKYEKHKINYLSSGIKEVTYEWLKENKYSPNEISEVFMLVMEKNPYFQ